MPAGVKIANYDWDFNGDGRYDGTCDGDSPSASHPFRKAGTQRVGLRLTDQFGRTSVSTRAVTVTSAERNLAKAAVFTCEDPVTKADRPSTKDCVTTFGFSIIEVKARGAADQCFTVKSRSPFLSQKAGTSQAAERDRDTRVYNATIAGPVKLNGLPIPVPSQRLTEYDSGNATISADNKPVKIVLPIGPAEPLTLGNAPFEYKIKPVKGRVKLPPLKGSGKLPFFGGLKLGGGVEVHLLKHSAEVFLSLRLPEIFKFSNDRVAEGRVTLRTTNAKDVQFEGLRISGIPQVFLGPLYVSNLFFDYQRTGEVWRGGANFQLAAVSPVEIKAAPPPPDYGFGLRGGRFDYAGGGIGFPNPPRPQIFPGVGLVEIGGAIGIDPVRFTGRMAIDVGGFIVVDGSAFIGLANEAQPYDFPEEFAPPGLGFLAGRKLDTRVDRDRRRGEDQGADRGRDPADQLLRLLPVPGLRGVRRRLQVQRWASASAWTETSAASPRRLQRTFNLEGNVQGLRGRRDRQGLPRASGAVVSSKGIGFCTIVPLPVPFDGTIPGEGGRRLHVGRRRSTSMVLSCDTGPYKEARPSAAPHRRAAASPCPPGCRRPWSR